MKTSMNRRNLLASLASLPFVGWVFVSRSPAKSNFAREDNRFDINIEQFRFPNQYGPDEIVEWAAYCPHDSFGTRANRPGEAFRQLQLQLKRKLGEAVLFRHVDGQWFYHTKCMPKPKEQLDVPGSCRGCGEKAGASKRAELTSCLEFYDRKFSEYDFAHWPTVMCWKCSKCSYPRKWDASPHELVVVEVWSEDRFSFYDLHFWAHADATLNGAKKTTSLMCWSIFWHHAQWMKRSGQCNFDLTNPSKSIA